MIQHFEEQLNNRMLQKGPIKLFFKVTFFNLVWPSVHNETVFANTQNGTFSKHSPKWINSKTY